MWTEQDQSGQNEPNRTKVDKIDRIGLNLTKWTEWTEWDRYGQMGPNRTKVNKMDQIRSKWTNSTKVNRIGKVWTEQTELYRSGLNKKELTELDRMNFSGKKGLNRAKQDHIGPKHGPNRTNAERIRLLNVYYFYCIFRAHISNF